VLAPLAREYHAFPALWRQEDGFAGYPRELGALFALIARERVHGVVFVGGDLHLSAIADIELRAPDERPVQVLQVVASGLYAPLPFTNTPWHCYSEGRQAPAAIHHAAEADVAAHYRATLLTDTSAHFVKVEAAARADDGRWQLRVRAIDACGQALAEEVRVL
jgi:cholesterol oxidase